MHVHIDAIFNKCWQTLSYKHFSGRERKVSSRNLFYFHRFSSLCRRRLELGQQSYTITHSNIIASTFIHRQRTNPQFCDNAHVGSKLCDGKQQFWSDLSSSPQHSPSRGTSLLLREIQNACIALHQCLPALSGVLWTRNGQTGRIHPTINFMENWRNIFSR